MPGPPAQPTIPLIIIGAGPHALTLVARLLSSDDELDFADSGEKVRARHWATRTRAVGGTGSRPSLARLAEGICVLDPSGSWMAAWSSFFAALEIPHLRSPAFLHLSPQDSDALRATLLRQTGRSDKGGPRAFAEAAARHLLPAEQSRFSGKAATSLCASLSRSLENLGSGEAGGQKGPPRGVPCCAAAAAFAAAGGTTAASPPARRAPPVSKGKAREFGLNLAAQHTFALPSYPLFMAGCAELLSSYQGLLPGLVRQGSAARVVPLSDPMSSSDSCPGEARFAVHTASGEILLARSVVVAIGPQGRPRIPAWAAQAGAAGPGLLLPSCSSPSQRSFFHTAHIPALFPAAGPDGATSSFLDEPWDAARAPPGPLRDALRGRRVVIIGGGLCAGHLFLVALRSGCRSVTLLVRKKSIQVRPYDLKAMWMSRARQLLLGTFLDMDPAGE
jgi:hypothetical protein